MALSDITLKTARSDLRSRLNKLTTEEFADAELNQWLTLGQYDTFVRLSVISDIWYGTSETVAITAPSGTVTEIALTGNYGADKIAKVTKLIDSSGTLIPFYEDKVIHSLKDISGYDSAYGINWYGENLYVFVGSSATPFSTESCKLFFISKPTTPTADTDNIDVPSEFVDLVIMFAQAKALAKLGMTPQKREVEGDIAEKFNEIKSLYASEIGVMAGEKQPGIQTARQR